MLKSSFFIALIIAGFGITSVRAQSSVDAGVSTHNYKHPNKAAAARAKQSTGKTITVASLNTVESYYKRQNRNTFVTTTPKYAPRPAALVVTRTYQKENLHLNPHLSPRNYKTQNTYQSKSNMETADYQISSDSTLYPTVD
ncbi:hypothetical protein [Dyadobacter sp. NIV53]|uniref:hypothetical protein n=1 Tax=Dyadobacter sp. NIV53 TaxID=2861765 RepID=UPI001C86B48D|nr:hypothetical protein [Dyadobacter sp. NIV53]